MIKNSLHLTMKVLLTGVFFVIIIGLVQSVNFSPVYPSTNVSNIIPEKGTTLTNLSSNQPDDGIGKTFIISSPPPSLNNSIKNSTDSLNSKPMLINESTDNNTITTNNNTTPSADFLSPTQEQNDKNISINPNQNNEFQRGEYKIDHNGIHYYDINNCSMTKGSSGIGNLSECEDAEKETREE